jgi:anti-sigma factor RsiW
MANHLSFNMFNQLVQGRASQVEEAKAKRHLASCPRCRSELEWLRRIHALQAPPGGFEIAVGELGRAY